MQISFEKNIVIAILFSLNSLFFACSAKENAKTQNLSKEEQTIALFNADSAYSYIQTQVDFGPRVPDTKAHEACGDYLINEIKRFGAEVSVQEMKLKTFDGKTVNARNIIGSYNVESPNRVLLLAHWDSRPWSDQDSNPANHTQPVDGANDGASGVGVLLEIARQLQLQEPVIGVDILFVDVEDHGEPRWVQSSNSDSWCLGTQYWARNPHVPGYTARYGILLDMVGAPGATFPKEGFSMRYAANIVEKVWSEAAKSGYSEFFINKQGSYITDDHVPVIEIAGIPTIDIIHLTDNGFADYWHTQDDTMKNIDKKTLQAVGQTVMNVIYNEKE
jgi:Zn-dependent M28 family amino/carboxypeptidase